MKKFCVHYMRRVNDDTTVEARNEKEARKKFLEIHPDERITDVWEVEEKERS